MAVVSVLPRSIRVAVIVISCSFLLVVLQCTEVVAQSFEALLPVPAVLLDPPGDLAQRFRRQPARPPLGLPALLDEAGSLEHLEVLRDARQAHVEGRRQLRDRRL